jgi:hypothetical protein
VLGIGVRLGLLLRLGSLRGCLLLSPLLGLLLLPPAANSSSSCTDGSTGTGIPGDRTYSSSPGCTFGGTFDRPPFGVAAPACCAACF